MIEREILIRAEDMAWEIAREIEGICELKGSNWRGPLELLDECLSAEQLDYMTRVDTVNSIANALGMSHETMREWDKADTTTPEVVAVEFRKGAEWFLKDLKND